MPCGDGNRIIHGSAKMKSERQRNSHGKIFPFHGCFILLIFLMIAALEQILFECVLIGIGRGRLAAISDLRLFCRNDKMERRTCNASDNEEENGP